MVLDRDMEEYLLEALKNEIDRRDPYVSPDGVEIQITHVDSFSERGVMTMSRGLVIEVTSQFTPEEGEDEEPRTERAQFQLTIVRSR